MAKPPQSFSQVARGYANLWNKCELVRRTEALKIADRILQCIPSYKPITDATGVPEWVIGIIHYREGNLDFGTYLGNGQSLKRKTTIEPKNRGPFRTFTEGALDALRYEKFDQVKDWSAARFLYEMERWNGWGYWGKINSPYNWGGTNLQQRGKYTRDHYFDPNVMDTQLGSAAILKALCERSITINKEVNPDKPASQIAQERTMPTTTPTVTVDVKPWYAKRTVWLAGVSALSMLVGAISKGALTLDPNTQAWIVDIAMTLAGLSSTAAIGTAVTSSTVTPTGAEKARSV